MPKTPQKKTIGSKKVPYPPIGDHIQEILRIKDNALEEAMAAVATKTEVPLEYLRNLVTALKVDYVTSGFKGMHLVVGPQIKPETTTPNTINISPYTKKTAKQRGK